MTSDLTSAIELVWQRNRSEIDRRVATLEEAVAAMLTGDLSHELRGRAEADAHKLAGSLAMFGFPTGSRRAREVEKALRSAAASAVLDVPPIADAVLALREEFDERSRQASAARDAAASAPPNGDVERTILVIDDSALIRGIVQIGLGAEQGWRVRVAASGTEGLDIASRERPDAILLDVEMPGVDGPDTLARLRTHESAREIPVLFMTGHATARDRAGFAGLGAAGIIVKPFDPAGLAGEIRRLLSWAR